MAEVVSQFRKEMPSARVYVFDNNSTDRTAELARAAGAEVRSERRQGKGYVVQSMFREVDADAYVMVDGDGTYPARDVHALLAPVLAGEADMVVGSRLHTESRSQFRQLNRFGNRLVRLVLNSIFRVRLTDILSGYRAFGRRFVKRVPLFGGGFEIETELTVKAVERGYRVLEVPIDLVHRPEGSHSKIQFFRDGLLILNTILALFRDYKPLTFFGGVGVMLLSASLVPALAVFVESLGAGALGRLPFALAALVLALSGLLSVTVGLVLHSIARRSQEFEYHMLVIADEFERRSAANETEGRSIAAGDGGRV